MKPLVSVIIAGYKREYIRQTIDSILVQTYTNYEIIVIDDGSPHNLKEVLQDYIDKKQIYYFFQENKKMAAAKNHGIRRARGELLAFLDDDDLWVPEKLAKQVPCFEDKKVGLVYGWSSMFFNHNIENHKDSQMVDKVINRTVLESLLISEYFFPSGTVVIRKECVDKVGYFNDSPQCYGVDDSDLWIRICRHYDVKLVPEILLLYRIHDAQVSGNTNMMIRNGMKMKCHWIREFNMGKHLLNQQMAHGYCSLGYNCRESNKLKALGYYLKAIYYQCRLKYFVYCLKLLIPVSLKSWFRARKSTRGNH